MVITALQLPVIGLEPSAFVVLVIAAFAGGAFGAALGALPAFCFTGFLVAIGEAAAYAGAELAGSITGAVAFGPVFGPHVSFAGGAAAAAYAARQNEMGAAFDFHNAKAITFALGTKPSHLAVGGAFGIVGMLIRQISGGLLLPWDPIAMGVTLSALLHRLVFGYSIVGVVAGDGIFDMSPFERGEKRSEGEVSGDADKAGEERFAVEPWLPHQYKWSGVAFTGFITGVLGGYIWLETGSYFLGFGISAASLTFLNLGVEKIPVTHHMTLPASTAGAAVVASDPGGSALLVVVVAAIFGVYGALLGEVWQRIFYAHADTHWDPPAAAITLATFTIAILYILGVFPGSAWVPALGL
ncbi:hypothetical protein [Haloarcula nitratireducens]|uniref:DUF7973 domain-containing protein n=1 Tax=Haloarcula nitratireducens TaxID=2487749 RepID=A0AAW4P6M2_9EURY|nr:hypothetical protein [Halomicroarcula nitratireducens]MBX0293522.1 hypothetical protein [Halomicroarcula nitratireducens]